MYLWKLNYKKECCKASLHTHNNCTKYRTAWLTRSYSSASSGQLGLPYLSVGWRSFQEYWPKITQNDVTFTLKLNHMVTEHKNISIYILYQGWLYFPEARSKDLHCKSIVTHPATFFFLPNLPRLFPFSPCYPTIILCSLQFFYNTNAV